jgi:hypothetical protein
VIADKSKYKIEPLGDHDRAAFSCENALAKKAVKYGRVGFTLLGRMAVDARYKRFGVAGLALMNALKSGAPPDYTGASAARGTDF